MSAASVLSLELSDFRLCCLRIHCSNIYRTHEIRCIQFLAYRDHHSELIRSCELLSCKLTEIETRLVAGCCPFLLFRRGPFLRLVQHIHDLAKAPMFVVFTNSNCHYKMATRAPLLIWSIQSPTKVTAFIHVSKSARHKRILQKNGPYQGAIFTIVWLCHADRAFAPRLGRLSLEAFSSGCCSGLTQPRGNFHPC